MRTLIASLLAAVVLFPVTAAGWSFDVHRFVTDRAIELLPDAIRPFYQKHRTFLVEHSIDPDLWRNAGFLEEPPRHFLDFDAYGAYPFTGLPRDYDAAVAKYGKDTIVKNGTVPWRGAEMYDRLVKSFTDLSRGDAPYALEDVKFFSAVLSHYVGDPHVPFHAVLNYDGQLTNQHGIHSRFEGELFSRYKDKLSIKPPTRAPVKAARDFIFDTLLESALLVDPVLAADRTAIAGRELYDDEYFDKFFGEVRPLLEKRLGESIASVAAAITGAWEQGGRPELPLDPKRPPSRVRRGNPQ